MGNNSANGVFTECGIYVEAAEFAPLSKTVMDKFAAVGMLHVTIIFPVHRAVK